MKTSGHSTAQHNATREERIIENKNKRSRKEQIKINVFRRKEIKANKCNIRKQKL